MRVNFAGGALAYSIMEAEGEGRAIVGQGIHASAWLGER